VIGPVLDSYSRVRHNPVNAFTGVLLTALLLLAVVTVSASLNILLRGRVYRWLKPESRPRRWVLIWLLVLLAVFAIWFAVWMLWSGSPIADALTLTFLVVFAIVGLTFRWLGGIVDWNVERKGWPLR
jgi:hypothetical protein